MNQWETDVLAFHTKFGHHIEEAPTLPPVEVQDLRGALIEEEINELLLGIETKDLAEIADGIVDGLYVLIGTAISYGIKINPIWQAVQAANMAKEPAKELHKKPVKPAGWEAPDVEALLLAQGATF